MSPKIPPAKSLINSPKSNVRLLNPSVLVEESVRSSIYKKFVVIDGMEMDSPLLPAVRVINKSISTSPVKSAVNEPEPLNISEVVKMSSPPPPISMETPALAWVAWPLPLWSPSTTERAKKPSAFAEPFRPGVVIEMSSVSSSAAPVLMYTPSSKVIPMPIVKAKSIPMIKSPSR